ncbi:N-acetylmuramic acid 6-phosphate etherase [Roseibium sp.]|uniref:N-acetylmuramic acid 6-phosphate etherase n=1 Tax=Roseibium sp. TaxID=1936156 RepID=UPI003D11CD9E
MPEAATEKLHNLASGLDSRPLEDVAAILIDGQVSAAQATSTATELIAAAADDMATSISTGGALYYIAAGSSGLMAAADAMELGGTFGIPEHQVQILMAGGIPTSAHMPGDTEDATTSLAADLATLSKNDTIIVVSASGSTPYTLEAARLGKEAGATVIAIANNPNAPLFAMSKHAIYLPTAPEVVSGSTRMGAGTAQKIALNALSTLMALNLGHIYDGMMVNLRADNIKLRDRAERMVATITGVSDGDATGALKSADGNVKTACLLAAGASSIEQAISLLENTRGHLRPALEQIRAETRKKKPFLQTEGKAS